MVIFATILIIQSYAIAESSEYIDTCNFIQNYQCCSKDTIGCTFLFYSFNSLIVKEEQSSILLDDQAKEKKLTLPFTSTELYQDNIKYYNFPTDYIYRPLQNK